MHSKLYSVFVIGNLCLLFVADNNYEMLALRQSDDVFKCINAAYVSVSDCCIWHCDWQIILDCTSK